VSVIGFASFHLDEEGVAFFVDGTAMIVGDGRVGGERS
jgi:hypothetical protein